MKLLNYTLKYLWIAVLLVISIWAALFYFNMMDEIRDSIEDGLESSKRLVIRKVHLNPNLLQAADFSEHAYAIREIPESIGLYYRDHFKDTLMVTVGEDDREPFRMLSTVFLHDDRYYELKVVASTVEEDDLIEQLLYSILALYGLILISIIGINNFMLKKIWAPFYTLLDQLKTFRLDKARAIVPMDTRIKEFRELNATVHALLEHSISTYSSQKQFIENAAHELQTPLAISLNRLELLVENESLGAHAKDIEQVIRTLERLTRLNKSLLLLSRIENKQYGDAVAVSINELMIQLLDEWTDIATMKEISLELVEATSLAVQMNRELAIILISNLLKNAIYHNIPKGRVRVSIFDNRIVVQNDGMDTPLDAHLIFKRFAKGDNQKSGNGLGLAIVKAITDRYGYKLEYQYVNNQHQISVYFI